jgi:Ca-activated chloride channel family protein
MRLEWPWALPALGLVPLLVLCYLLWLRRKRRVAVRYASLALIRDALPGRSRWRRHVPFALLLACLASLVLALARPEVTVAVASSRTSIILAIDVSRSMCATDVEPNRLVVAQDAASNFVDDLRGGTRLGIVAFAGSAQIVVPPSTDRDRLREAIAGLTTSIGTAIGNALLTSIDALAEVNPDIAPSTVDLSEGSGAPPLGGYEPDIIVLLTDGANTRGVDPLVAAQQAADRRVRVYTIGFGTTSPDALVCTPEQLGGDAFARNFGGPGALGTPGSQSIPGGLNQYLLLDEETLQGIADTTGGEFFRAENADQLVDVFRSLPERVVRQDEPREISVLFAALGAAFVGVALGLSLRWNRYP